MFDANGKNIPCTVIEAGPCTVTQVRTLEKEGYEAIQLAFDDAKEKNTTKAIKNHLAKANCAPKKKIAEFTRFEIRKNYGDILKVDVFEEGEFIDIVGISKGKGFQGVVDRHGFGGVGGQTHGQHNRLRAPGSLGASSFPSRVMKGMRMAGRTGGDRVKAINLQVLKIMVDKNIIVVKGSVPGPKGSYLLLERWK